MTDQEKALEKIETDEKRLNEQLAETVAKKAVLKAEIARDVIADIKSKIKIYDITPEQLFENPKPAKEKIIKKVKSPSKVAEFLYRSNKGEGWTGSRGRMPGWVKAIKDGGGDIEKYRI